MLPRKLQSLASPRPSRRTFIIGTAAVGAGLAVGFRLADGGAARAAGSPAAAPPANPLAAYVVISPDNRVRILAAHMDMGQGIYFGTATLVNEELGADWAMIDVDGGWGNTAAYGNLAWGGTAQGTGGSTGMTSSWERYRKAGAAARLMLIAAAAETWGVAAGEIRTEQGRLSHASGRTATYGEMAAKAATMPLPAVVPLKPKDAWTSIGNADLRRFDSARKSRGQQAFTIDLTLDGMKTALMIHPLRFGATVSSFDAAAAKAVPGVVDVVAIPRGVAVIADGMWPAMKARDLVTVVWDESKAEKRSSATILAGYREQASKPGFATARTDGDVASAFASAAKVIEATYEFPYLAHAALEPLNAVARKQDGIVEVWGGHQMPDLYQYLASQVAGVTPDKVRLHVMKTGGGFGRRAVIDADVVVEAVSIAAATGWAYPVKVQWTRDNDMKGGRYRPAYVHRVKAGLDGDGRLVAWENHIVGQSILKGTPFEDGLVKNGIDLTSVEGASNIPYDIANVRVDLSTMDAGVPVLWWRAVGSTHTAYAVETFIDELAEAAGKDPVAYRLDMLAKHPRHHATLQLAAEKAGWGTATAAGRYRGVALAESFNTVVAQVVEISMAGSGFKVEKVTCAVDCGIAVNPDQVKAQMEGGIGFGLGAILAEEITLTDGVVDQANYDSYTPLRIDQMPEVEVHIVSSDAAPTGAGEPGVPPIGPALANAVYAATKRRVRVLPFSKGLTA
jgi:isoquinoline 1-oxidoreductase beta subunit